MNFNKIKYKNGNLEVPNNPTLLFIEGDGVGPEIWKATKIVLDAAVRKAYSNEKQINWMEVFAGEKSYNLTKEWLPEETLDKIKEYKVGIKGPLTTPVGGGIRSINVALRQKLELFSCIRPVRHYSGVPSPVKKPELVDMVIFRENMEDVYSGIEWKEGSEDVKKVINFLNNNLGQNIPMDSGIGIKPISKKNTKNLVRSAMKYAIENNRKSLTLVHKGNIMKFTEGAFKEWGYEVLNDEFSDYIITEKDFYEKYDGKQSENKIVIKDRIADAFLQQILIDPLDSDVIATMNLNGDFISDALAAQVGGLGIAPGANIGDDCAIFEATHGTAPNIAGENKVNPGSLILSGEMLLRFLGWKEAADLVVRSLEKTIQEKKVTFDLERLLDNATLLSCSEFSEALVDNL